MLTKSYPLFANLTQLIMTPDQLKEFRVNYADYICDGLPYEDLYQIAVECLVDSYEKYEYIDIKDEILQLYDKDVLQQLLPKSYQQTPKDELYDEVVQYYNDPISGTK